MAGFYGLEAVRDLHFFRIDPRQPNERRARKIGILFRQSLIIDFPSRTDTAIRSAVHRREQNRNNIGKVVPGGAVGSRQQYMRPKAVLAYSQQGELKAYLDAADNSSSGKDSKIARLEIFGKQHLDRLIASRYHAIGMVALGPGVRPHRSEVFDPNTVNIVDVMAYASMVEKPGKQSVSGYSWTDVEGAQEDHGEDWLEDTFASWGLTAASDERLPKYELGDGLPIWQQRWVFKGGLSKVQGAILSKSESEFALEHALLSAHLL